MTLDLNRQTWATHDHATPDENGIRRVVLEGRSGQDATIRGLEEVLTDAGIYGDPPSLHPEVLYRLTDPSTPRSPRSAMSDEPKMTSEHQMDGLDRDGAGFDFCRCSCGWLSPPSPDTEVALDFWADHIREEADRGWPF